MKILHISDTHQYHTDLLIGQEYTDIDFIIHSGDATNYRSPISNFNEFKNFLDFFPGFISEDIPKIYVPGNHDSAIHAKMITAQDFSDLGIILLIDEGVTVEGYKIYGSPWTPTFGSWYYMSPRHKIGKYWDAIPEDTEILVTHGPPMGILDIAKSDLSHSHSQFNYTKQHVGDKALYTRIQNLENLKWHLFGHVHDNAESKNSGIFIPHTGPKYSNASCITDGKFDKGLTSFGNIIII